MCPKLRNPPTSRTPKREFCGADGRYTRRGTGKRVEEVSKPDRKCKRFVVQLLTVPPNSSDNRDGVLCKVSPGRALGPLP